jgi:prepilin peptidase CpaA
MGAGTVISALMTAVLLVILALAVREDLIRQRIPNALNLAGLLLGVCLTTVADGASGGASAFGGALVGSASLMPFYLLRGMGAGDVKLMGAAGAFLGPADAFVAAVLTLIVGAVLALAIVAWRLLEAKPNLDTSSSTGGSAALPAAVKLSVVRKQRFPYAVAIAVSVVALLWQRGALATLVTTTGIG